ncbi:MAG: hypothetical protein V4649_17120 [Bacteroidota bacterium]
MAEHTENNEQEQFDQQTENELKKIKLSLEHGMDMPNSNFEKVAPEIEGQFLDYIQQWEQQYAQERMTTVYDLCGRPEWTPAAQLAEGQLPAALEKLFMIMDEHGVALDVLAEVADEVLYRFITEELFAHETTDIRIPGMRHCFIYEEFHPNHAYDIKNRCAEVIDQITKVDKSDLAPWGLDDIIAFGGRSLTKDEFNTLMVHFRSAFISITVSKLECINASANEEGTEGKASYELSFSAQLEDTHEPMEFNGTCNFWLRCEYEWWLIHKLEFVGLPIH